MIESPQAFADSLPKTPLRQHIAQVYTVLSYIYGRGDGYDVHAVEAAAYSLREIARFTSMPDYIAHGIREEVLRDLGLPPGTTSAIRNPFEALSEALQKMKVHTTSPVTPDEVEAAHHRRYSRRIAEERRKGLAFVKAEAARVRKELGL